MPLCDDTAEGSAHVFILQGGSLGFTATIPHPTGGAGSRFGDSVDVVQTASGDYLAIIGSSADGVATPDGGAAYVFEAHATDLTTWTLVATLTAPSPAALDVFGSAVSITEAHAVVGMPGADGGGVGGAGAIVVFDRIAGVWQPAGTVIAATTPQAGADFGFSVAIDGDTVVVGVPEAIVAGVAEPDSGAAEVFRRVGGAWVSDQFLVPFDCPDCTLAGGRFGHAVDLADDDLVVGAPASMALMALERGAVHHFRRDAGQFVERQRRVAADDLLWLDPGGLGQSVDLGAHPAGGMFAPTGGPGRTAILADGNAAFDAGVIAAPRLVLGGPSDCDGNGVFDVCELDPLTDCNQNGVLDVCDIADGTSSDCDDDGIPDECRLDPLVEIVWVVDTSQSVGVEPEEVCAMIDGVESALSAEGVRHRSSAVAIGNQWSAFDCIGADITVQMIYGTAIPDPAPCCTSLPSTANESWAGAAAIVSRNHRWVPGSVRIVATVSDECPWTGGTHCGSSPDNADALESAIKVLRCDGVYPLTISSIGASAQPIDAGQEMADLANGLWVQLDATMIPEAVDEIVEGLRRRARRDDSNENGILDRCGDFGFSMPQFLFDCNDNGIDDALEIEIDLDDGVGTARLDLLPAPNGNGFLDVCEEIPCAPLGDLDGSWFVGFDDLLVLLANWGPCGAGACAGDLDENGEVAFDDLLTMLANWGWCPQNPSPCDGRLGTVIAAPESIWDCYAKTGGDPVKLAACIEAMILAGTP